YFLYNGGNDSMDTCYKIGKYLTDHNYPCKIIGVPKTIDNDLFGTDHCPGYGSAAKYIATSCMELARDSRVYDKGSITIVEVMGRNAGWLTAASAVASYKGWGPDLIYVPELPFDIDDFLAEVKEVFVEKGDCMVAVSEGIKDREDKYISEYQKSNAFDSFNHIQLGGVGSFLAALVKQSTNAKVRAIEFSLLQRCAAHIASKTDVDEAYLAGAEAVKAAINGKSNIMIAFDRAETKEYKLKIKELPLEMVANTEKKLPESYLCSDRHFVTEKFMDYVLPLIEGEANPPYVDGVPRFAMLKRVKTR
ncbi:MAG TPA: diphosphate--fructose-6-phosphate 1-phosphotransferase, partial [Clostridia bacterium]|nr:diphosphate--fructose-6-phosphate 1-phosphotransferase [Clostridia bacterium]